MTRYALLLRAVNVGGRNTLAMADLRAVLAGLGHSEVRTVLNSGNAVFTTETADRSGLAAEVEQQLHLHSGLTVRAAVRSVAELAVALDELPAEIESSSYALLAFPVDPATPGALQAVRDWEVAPERLVVGNGVVYVGYAGPMHRSALSNAALERRLGVACTGRTPATIRKLLA